MEGKKLLLLLSLVCGVSRVLGQDCSDFTLGSCNFDESSVVDRVALPADKNVFILCQDLCQNDDLCNFFVFDSSEGDCALYSDVDYSSCTVQSGPMDPDVSDCQFTGSGCEQLTEVECIFDDGIGTSGVDSAEDCQELLRDNGDDFGTEYFVYDAEATTCTLLLGPESRTCPIISGPALPDFDNQCVALRLVVGLGFDGSNGEDGLYRDDFESFQVDSGTECDGIPPYPRDGKSGAVSGIVNGALWVCGGYLDSIRVTTNLCYSFDNEWEEQDELRDNRELAAAVVDPEGNFYISGGEEFGVFRDTVEMLSDPDIGWDFNDDMRLPEGRSRHCMATFDQGTKILIAGGSERSDEYPITTYVFDLTSPGDGWVNTGNLTFPRQYADCIEVGGRVMIAGGDTLSGDVQDTVEWFDPDSGEWTVGEPLPEPRQGHRLTKENRESTRVFLAGGSDEFFNYPKNVLVYDLDSDSWDEADFELDGGRSTPIVQFVPELALLECI